MDILQYYEAIKTFVREEKDTWLGLILFEATGLLAVRYILLEGIDSLKAYTPFFMAPALVLIFIIWINFRNVPLAKNKFNIAISQFEILMLDVKTEMSSDTKRNLQKELVDYVYSALHFNKEKLELDNYLEVVRLSQRFKLNQRNAKKTTHKIGAELLIWGDAYYKGDYLYFKPRFEFLWEPTNVYYAKFKKSLNNLKTFKINISKSLQQPKGELSELLHYLSFLGLMFNGIHLTHLGKFQDAKKCFDTFFKKIKKESFNSRSLTDIYLATRFFSAQNLHKWGNYLLKVKHKDSEAMKLYEKAARSFFARAEEMEKLHDIDAEDRLEHSLLYGIYLLTKEGKHREAEKKLDSIKNSFKTKNKYLYYLYKGFVQKTTAKAKPWFDKALKTAKDNALVEEKIADYFFSKGKFKDSIKYFEERLKITQKQIYSPELLEEQSHRKLSKAYLHQARLVAGIREKISAARSHKENIDRED